MTRRVNQGAWPWLMWGLAAISVGLAIWATTFVLVPAGVVMIIVGVIHLFRPRRT